MSNRSAELTQGSFANKGSLVLFLSWLEESRRARVSLEVNNVLVEATYDAGTDTLHWNGYNAALTPEDKEALVAFSRELEQSLGAATIFAERDMPLHERLLYERVLYWAEAPVGLPLTPARTLRMPPIRQGVKRAVSIDDVEAAVCQRSGEDGVLRSPTARPESGK